MTRSFIGGGSFILDAPEQVPAVWGDGNEVLWSQGEPLLIAGPPGVGKSTLAQQLALARLGGPLEGDVLGFPVAPDPDRKVIYLAADRPNQAARSMRRMVKPSWRSTLDSGLDVWQGPLPFSLVAEPEQLAVWLAVRAGTVIIDSLYNVVPALSDEQSGQAIAHALGHLVSAGVEVIALHHPRKAQTGAPKPKTLPDVYGSAWITAAAGSVVLLWGDAGDSQVELLHLKQPASVVGPLQVEHDHATGRSSIVEGAGERASDEDLQKRVRAFVAEHGPAKTSWVRKGVKARYETVAAALKALAATEEIVESADGWMMVPKPREPAGNHGNHPVPSHAHGAEGPGGGNHASAASEPPAVFRSDDDAVEAFRLAFDATEIGGLD